MGYFITLSAKYFFSDELSAEQLSNIVKERISEFALENYQEYKYHNKIIRICESLYNGSIDKSFKEREYIPIYENELNLINTLPTDKQKKVMFTFFAVARYMDCDGWINKKNAKDISKVFQLANVTLTSAKRNELLHELYINEYITFGKKVNNLNIHVNLDASGAVAYKITDFENIGNQYIGNFKKGYKQCKRCGKAIKNTGNKKMYCNKCALDNELKSKKKWWDNH